MICYVFPGQGCQKVGMGKSLFKKYNYLLKEIDEVLGYSIEELCIYDKENKLNSTQFTQPAIYIVNALKYLDYLEQGNKKPDYLAGHSLGEYNALFAAGVFDLITGLKLVKKRAELMSKVKDGSMASIIGISSDEIRRIIIENKYEDIYIANFNSKTQTVVSGNNRRIEELGEYFDNIEDARYIKLNVSGPFHSKLMKNAAEKFSEFIDSIEFKCGNIPVIANVNAREYKSEDIKLNLVNQIYNSVKWVESVENLIELGCTDFVEIGDSRILRKLIKNILNNK